MVNDELKGIWDDLKSNFSDLEFIEDTHTYFVCGKKLPSVSSLISNFYIPFDTKNEIIKYAAKHGYDEDDVENSWTGENLISTNKGSDIHIFGEDYAKWKYFNIGEKPKCTCKQKLAIIQFWNDLPKHILPVALEIQMYSKKYGYCGTADILLYDFKKNVFIIADYKSNKELISSFEQSPLLHINTDFNLKQDNYGKYSLQFSFYQILLEDIGINVKYRILIWLQEGKVNGNKKLYQAFYTQDVTKELRMWLDKKLF